MHASRAKRWWTIVAGATVLMALAVPLAAADETTSEDTASEPPPPARCEYPDDAGVGAAGAGAAVSHVSWGTHWTQLCVQTTSPGEAPLPPNPVVDNPGCDHDDRDAVELFTSREAAAVEAKSSCDDTDPTYPGTRSQTFTSCSVAVTPSDSDVVTQTCREQGREGPSGGGETTWDYGWELSDSITASVDDGEVAVTRTSTTESDYDPDGTHTERISVGADGIERDYVSDYPEAPPDGYHCEDAWSVSPTDPLANGMPPRTPGCL